MEKSIYIYLSKDGGIFIVLGETGFEGWITEYQMFDEIKKIVEQNGVLLLNSQNENVKTGKIVKRIIETKIKIHFTTAIHQNIKRNGNCTTLMYAAFSGKEDLVKDLINREVNIDDKDEAGYTALMYAANSGNLNNVEILLMAGANSNIVDNNGSSALMFAAQHGYQKIVEKLVEFNCDPKRIGNHGLTARNFAEQNGFEKTAEYLKLKEKM